MLKDPSRRYMPRAEPDPQLWHGTLGGYTNHHCKCDECVAAHRAYCANARAERVASTPWDEIPHGTANGYNNYRCRCEPCKGAMAAARTSWPSAKNRDRRKERSDSMVGMGDG